MQDRLCVEVICIQQTIVCAIWLVDVTLTLNSTQLYCDVLAAEQLNSWIARYSSSLWPIHVA